jgi:hypothetical protein
MLLRRMWRMHGRRLAGRPVLGALVAVVVLAVAEPAVGLAQAHWSVVPSPNGSGQDELTAVSCVPAGACTAVGARTTRLGVKKTVIESWNGTAWSLVPSPNVAKADSYLYGVSCVSASACIAVGYSLTRTPSAYSTLIESWNGTAWSVVPSPNQAGTNNVLDSVSCVSASACIAVGGGPRALIESWDGTAWSVVPSLDPGSVSDTLYGVSCVSATACTAVGDYGNTGGTGKTLIETWDGTAWSVVPSPNRAGSINVLNGVSCMPAGACTAVGARATRAGNKTLIESWNGTAWSLAPSPNNALANNWLNGVSCVSPGACTAVGNYAKGSGASKTLIETWNGTAWSVVPSPNEGASGNVLNGVSCVSASACTAAGYFNTSTLVEAS